MNFEIDHFFVLTDPGALLADRLISAGLTEGEPNTHPGQGTSNRRFFFTNSMLELLWLHDREEAMAGPGTRMNIAERVESTEACPFGLIFRPNDKARSTMPFAGWKYEPSYLDPPNFLHVGANSDRLIEPLLIFAPFIVARSNAEVAGDNGRVTGLRISSPENNLSPELSQVAGARGVRLELGKPHLLEVYCESQKPGHIDMRPDLPLVIYR